MCWLIACWRRRHFYHDAELCSSSLIYSTDYRNLPPTIDTMGGDGKSFYAAGAAPDHIADVSKMVQAVSKSSLNKNVW